MTSSAKQGQISRLPMGLTFASVGVHSAYLAYLVNWSSAGWFVGPVSFALSVWFLHLLDELPSGHKPTRLPRAGAYVVQAAALAFAGSVAHLTCRWLIDFPHVGLVHQLTFSAPVALGLQAAVHYFLKSEILAGRHKTRVVLDVLPAEAEEIKAAYAWAGFGDRVDYLSVAELKQALIKGNVAAVDLVVISRSSTRSFAEDGYLLRAHLSGIPIQDRKSLMSELTGSIRSVDSDSWWFLITATRQTPILRAYSRVKATVEPLIALVLAILLLPVAVVIAAVIKFTSAGPAFYWQLRTGHLGKTFRLVKFRSMTVSAEEGGPQWAVNGDLRVTPVGRFLRATRLDELPQLWNVIRGEMSFVGPRPERPEFYQQLKPLIPHFSLRTIVRPGISGWAQVCAGYASTVEESRTKLEYDLYYIKHMSPRLDILTIIKTIRVALMNSERAQTMGDPQARPGTAPRLTFEQALEKAIERERQTVPASGIEPPAEAKNQPRDAQEEFSV